MKGEDGKDELKLVPYHTSGYAPNRPISRATATATLQFVNEETLEGNFEGWKPVYSGIHDNDLQQSGITFDQYKKLRRGIPIKQSFLKPISETNRNRQGPPSLLSLSFNRLSGTQRRELEKNRASLPNIIDQFTETVELEPLPPAPIPDYRHGRPGMPKKGKDKFGNRLPENPEQRFRHEYELWKAKLRSTIRRNREKWHKVFPNKKYNPSNH